MKAGGQRSPGLASGTAQRSRQPREDDRGLFLLADKGVGPGFERANLGAHIVRAG